MCFFWIHISHWVFHFYSYVDVVIVYFNREKGTKKGVVAEDLRKMLNIRVNSLEFIWDRDSYCFTGSTTGFVSRTERSSFVLRTTIFERHAFSQTDGQRVTLGTDKVTE